MEKKDICYKCGAVLDKEQAFCHYCGTPTTAPSKSICKKCGVQLANNAKFCPNCGCKQTGTKANIGAHSSSQKKKTNVCSILAIIFAIIGLIPLLNFLLVPLSIIFAIIGFTTGKNKGKKAKVASIIIVAISIAFSVMWMIPAMSGSSANDSITNPSTNNTPDTQTSACSHSYNLKGTSATCVSGGYATYQCSLCGNTQKNYESALGHSWSNNTCTKCGKTKDLKLDPKDNTILTIDEINIEINSVGGVEPEITYTNHTNKQIAYLYFTIKYYDRMGYAAYCKYEDTPVQRLKITGPIDAGVTDTSYWDPVMYNSTTAVSQPQKIEIVFTDGTHQDIICPGRYWYTGSYYGGALHE